LPYFRRHLEGRNILAKKTVKRLLQDYPRPDLLKGNSYAYPNPFSPLVANDAVRIHYKPKSDGYVTIKIYDFEMKLVNTILEDAYRDGGVEYDQTWDGTNGKGEIVANGIYFFKIEGPGGQEEWGKIGVLK